MDDKIIHSDRSIDKNVITYDIQTESGDFYRVVQAVKFNHVVESIYYIIPDYKKNFVRSTLLRMTRLPIQLMPNPTFDIFIEQGDKLC